MSAARPKYMAVQGAAFLVALTFLVVGVAGFIPGLTTNYHLLDWFGHHSGAMLFDRFAVSGLHNAVHLAFGVAGLLLARTYVGSRLYLLIGGLAYLGVWLYGLLIDHGSAANVLPVNSADNWLHLGLGGGMLLLALTLSSRRDPTKPRSRPRFRARARA